MKLSLILLLMLSGHAFAESLCDVRVGESQGMKVVEFATGNVVHSKMSLKETTASALLEEMINLQDMGVCEEKIVAKKCILKFEKKAASNQITLYRNQQQWISWVVNAKIEAQEFVKKLKKAGFCS